MLVLRNVAGPIVRSNRGWSGPIMLVLIGCHFTFFLVLKYLFYKHRTSGGKSAAGGDYGNGGGDMDDGMNGVDGDEGEW